MSDSVSTLLLDDTGGAILTDSAMARAFEQFVHSQKPAEQPWQPVTDYSFEARKAIEGPHARLILETFRPRSLVDAGCGSKGHLFRMLREEQPVWACGMSGFDIQPADAWVDRQDLLNLKSNYGPFELVICREVLEHLTVLQVRQAVRNLVKLSSKFIYVTTRFARSPAHFLSVDDHDDLDPTHITMMTKPFLRTLFILEGCKSRPDLELKMDHKRLGRVLVFEVA